MVMRRRVEDTRFVPSYTASPDSLESRQGGSKTAELKYLDRGCLIMVSSGARTASSDVSKHETGLPIAAFLGRSYVRLLAIRICFRHARRPFGDFLSVKR
jgi:hypothetical protein